MTGPDTASPGNQMEELTPRRCWGTFIAASGLWIALAGFTLYLAATDSDGLGTAILGSTILVASTAVVAWIPLSTLLTRFTETGLYQPRLWGLRHRTIHWDEVTQVGGTFRRCTISSNGETIVLNLSLFADPNDVIVLVRKRIPASALP